MTLNVPPDGDFRPNIPIPELKKLHLDLTNFENLIQIMGGGYSAVKLKVDMIYDVQEMIEEIISEEKNRIKNN